MDEVRYWNTARTQTEIVNHKDMGLVGNEVGLKAYWNFNDGSGNRLRDLVGTSDGTLYNMEDIDWTTDVPAWGALAVDILSPLQASLKGEAVALDWVTASEYNNKGFEIQRSKNTKVWKKLAWVNGNKENQTKLHYTYVDENPFNGINYYRYKQIDESKQYLYSNIVSVPFERLSVELYPNPSSNYTRIHISTKQSIKKMSIYDLKGNFIKQLSVEDSEIDISQLPKGAYTLKIDFIGSTIAKKIFVL